jgi:dTDP-4-amino-4,6-dideoxygalactose transaminase
MALKVPFLDLSSSIAELRPDLEMAQGRVLDRGCVLLGPELESFETEWASWVDARHTIGVANGLDALRLALEAVGVKQGDEVIVPSNTYIATWLAVSQLGARPIPVEPEPSSFLIDPNRIESAITSRTKAILPVHLYGQAADMETICSIAKKLNIAVVEDAAQAHGATLKGKRIGAHGDVVCWSFYPTKNLGALSDAGAVTTNNDAIAERVRIARNYGQRERYVCEVKGWNSRLDELSAAVLRVKLSCLSAWNEHRSKLAQRYQNGLQGLGLELPFSMAERGHAWHLFVIRHPQRNKIQELLQSHGIGSIKHYPIPPHLQHAYKESGFHEGDFPISEAMHNSCLSLPLHPHLSFDSQQYIIDCLNSIMRTINASY